MFRTLQSKLLLFFLIVSLSSIIFIIFVIQLSFYGSFQDYLEAKRTEQVQEVVKRLEEEYLSSNGIITGNAMMAILHHHAMVDQLYFRYYTKNNELTFDSTRHLTMMNPHLIVNNTGINLESEKVTIFVKGMDIGTLHVFYPGEFVNNDSEFLNQFNKYIIMAAIIIIFLSVIVSILLSKNLTQGLRQISQATNELKKNNFEIRLPEKQHVEEINQLANSFNELAVSLKKQEKLRKQFTNDLAHELRTPLATLRSQNEAFLDGVWQPTHERLKQSHGELMRLVRLVDDLEKLLAAENPRIQLNLITINISEVFNALIASLDQQFQQKGVNLIIEKPNPSISLLADRDRLFQIFVNLLNNSLKYTNKGGNVVLSCISDEKEVIFTIADDGLGISDTDLPFIFERFYRGEKSRSRETGGVGIGLSIAKALVEAHQGKITIESKLNIGTKVKLTFNKTI